MAGLAAPRRPGGALPAPGNGPRERAPAPPARPPADRDRLLRATGDGGGGSDPYRYHEYYVGQNFTMTVRLLAGSSRVNGGDVQFDIPSGYIDCSLNSSIKPLSGAITLRKLIRPQPKFAMTSTSASTIFQ